MSGLDEALGWLWIAGGALMMLDERRLVPVPLARPFRGGTAGRTGRRQRWRALAGLRYSLWFFLAGAASLIGWFANPVFLAVAGCFFVWLIGYDLRAWRRSRRRRRAARLAGGAPPANPG